MDRNPKSRHGPRRISRRLAIGLAGGAVLAAAVLLLSALPRRRRAVTPETEAVFTSTRCITCLAAAPNGDVWAGTPGGLLRRTPDGRWQKFTRKDALPSHEIRSLKVEGGDIVAVFPTSAARRTGDRWIEVERKASPDAQPPLPNTTAAAMWRGRTWAAPSRPMPKPLPNTTAVAMWRGSRYAATVAGLYVQSETAWRQVPLPPSSGTHVSALLPHGSALWAALFGDGVWAYDGESWTPVDLHLPLSAKEITALAAGRAAVWIGTRRAGLWELRGKTRIQHLQPDEPLDHNCQALAMYRGSLFVSTLEVGLAVRTSRGWGHFSPPQISSNAPRQMVVFQDRLYLRHGSGKLDRWNGVRWEANIGAGLPRRQVSALAADAERLYAAQWGGWSEYDGSGWTHHLDLPDLQGLPVTALCPRGDRLWIGTQNHGLAEYDRRHRRLIWHDERSGLPDDWITALAPEGATVAAGTYVGGLARRGLLPPVAASRGALSEGTFASGLARRGKLAPDAPSPGKPTANTLVGFIARQDSGRWTTPPELAGQNVTALEPDGSGGLFIATRNGVWHESPAGPLRRIQPASGFLDREAQCLCRVPGGLWIGMRTGLFFCPDAVLVRH